MFPLPGEQIHSSDQKLIETFTTSMKMKHFKKIRATTGRLFLKQILCSSFACKNIQNQIHPGS